jgi:hypothetical protein
MKVKILTKSECARELERADAFLTCLNQYTIENLLRKKSLTEYFSSLAEAAVDPTISEIEGIMLAFDDTVRPKWKELGLPEVAINFAVTNGKDMGMSNLPYTRGNTIFFSNKILSNGYMKSEHFRQLIAHECFHILSRVKPYMRHQLYAFFGFEQCEDVDIGIVNPDCPVNNYCLEIDGVKYVPYLEMPTSNVLSEHAMLYNIETKESVKAKTTKIFEMIGKTTAYVIHPEEICADFFMYLFVDAEDIDKTKVLQFKEKLLACV